MQHEKIKGRRPFPWARFTWVRRVRRSGQFDGAHEMGWDMCGCVWEMGGFGRCIAWGMGVKETLRLNVIRWGSIWFGGLATGRSVGVCIGWVVSDTPIPVPKFGWMVVAGTQDPTGEKHGRDWNLAMRTGPMERK